LNPVVVVVDLSLSAGDLSGLLRRIGARAPGAKLLLLSVHDQGTVADSALAAGADAVVLKRCLARGQSRRQNAAQAQHQQQAATHQDKAGMAAYQKGRSACLEGRGYTVK
jgi:DNA-binding NarL/FixJ family response regulator